MHITISATGHVELDRPSEFTAFDIQAADPAQSAVLDALGADATGAAEDDHVFVATDAVRRWAAATGEGPSEEWEAGFSAMLDFAASKGWMNEAGDAVKAHIEPS